MISESLWQGIIMDKTIQNMAKIREEIQSRNQEKKYDVNEMPEVAQMILDRLGIEEVPIPIVAIMKSLNFQVVAGELKDEISGIIGIDDDLVLASGDISHLLSGENDQSQSDRNNQCISFSFL